MKGFRKTRQILEAESGVNTPVQHIGSSRLVHYLKDAMRDTDTVYDLMISFSVQDSRALDDHLTGMGLLDRQEGSDDVNIWEEPPENMILEKDGEKVVVRAASVNNLVIKLTDYKNFDPYMIEPFLMTFRTFVTPTALFDKLAQRFNVPTEGASAEDVNGVATIQIRVIDLLKKWIGNYPEDFDEPLRLRVRNFLDYVATTPSAGRAKTLNTTFQKLQDTPKKEIYKPVDPLEPLVPPDFFTRKWDLLDIDPEEIARQITVCDWMIYVKIRPSELMEQSWSKPKLKYRSPNVLAMIKRFNIVSNWVASTIVQVETVKERAEVMTKFVQIAERLNALHNYNSLMSIIAGLNHSSISRLKYTVGEMKKDIQQTKKDLELSMSDDGNFRDYRARIAALPTDVPTIPHLGVFLTDLTFADENSDYVNGLVNFTKRVMVFNIIHQIRQRQTHAYRIQPVQQIMDKLLQLTIVDESKFYAKSLLLEPRNKSREEIK